MKQSLFQTFWQVAVDLMADILRYVTQGLSCLLASLLLLCSLSLHAEAPLLHPNKPFSLALNRSIPNKPNCAGTCLNSIICISINLRLSMDSKYWL